MNLWGTPDGKSPPQPSPEVIAKFILGFAKRRYFIRTCEREHPLFSCALVMPKLGKHVHVELMPSLALRVRDQSTGEILAQSMPGDFDTLDMESPALDEFLSTWKASREPLSVVADQASNGGEA